MGSSNKKVAYVLSGGGSLGSFQAGVLKKLHEQGRRPQAIYGTSAGALNAVGYAYGGGDEIWDIWANIKGRSSVMKFNWLNLILGRGAYSTDPLKGLISDAMSRKEPWCEAVVTAVNLGSGRLEYFSSHEDVSNFNDMVLASASIPVVMEPVGRWVDGGVREQTPMRKPIQDRFEKIVVILALPLTDPFVGSDWKFGFPAILSVGLRSIQIMSHEVFVNDMRRTLKYNKRKDKRKIELEIYAPTYSPMDPLDFNPEKIGELMNHGYEAEPVTGDF